MRNRIGALVLLLLVFGSTACGLADSEVNQACLVYSGGISEDKQFQAILPPGSTNNSVGAGSDTFCYNIDQRSWIAGPNGDTEPVQIVTSDEITSTIPYQLYFKLNVGTPESNDVFVQFHEDLGLKADGGGWTTEGWAQLLREFLEPQADRAIEQAALSYSSRDLRGNAEVRAEFARTAVANFRRNIDEVIGAQYFCGPDYNVDYDNDGNITEASDCGDVTLSVGSPTPTNPAVVQAIEQEQINEAAVTAQEVENRRIQAELEAQASQVELFGPEIYAYLQAVEAARAANQPPPPFFGTPPQPVIDVGS